jgi:hypothetical protein
MIEQSFNNSFPEYESALRDESLIQAYLDGIHRNFPSFVRAITYDPELELGLAVIRRIAAKGIEIQLRLGIKELKDRIKYKVGPGIFIGMRMPQTIYVTRKGFAESQNEGNLVSDLLFHETKHAHDIYYGLQLKEGMIIDYRNEKEFDFEILESLFEIKAGETQYRASKKAKMIGEEAYGQILHKIRQYVNTLSNRDTKTRFQEEIIIAAIRSVDDILMEQ